MADGLLCLYMYFQKFSSYVVTILDLFGQESPGRYIDITSRISGHEQVSGNLNMSLVLGLWSEIYDLSQLGAVVIVQQLDLQLPVQSVPITTKFESQNSAHGEVYSIQHYVIEFVSDFRQVAGFHQVLRFPPPIKLTATIQLTYC